MNKYFGKRVHEGIAIGKIIKFVNKINITHTNGLGYDIEFERFNESRKKVIKEYQEIYENPLNKNQSDVIMNFISLLDDLDFIETVESLLKEENINAEEAVRKTSLILQELFSNLDNEYLKERSKDIDEISNKVIKKLLNEENTKITEPSIILADEMTVSDLMNIDKNLILGIVFNKISPNSHIAIIVRSLSIPSIASINSSLIFNDGDLSIVDGKEGMLIISPTENEIEKYKNLQFEYNKSLESLIKYKKENIKTIDNKTLKVFANISSSYEVDNVIENSADGIGLFRSEFIYINSTTPPTEEEQYEHYKKCLESLKNKTVIIRTFDIGADKSVEYFNISKEKNPALGFRGVRLYKKYKTIFITQIKAILRASIYGDLRMMIPMITNIDEIDFVLEYINEVKQEFNNNNIKYNKSIKIGIMVETPAAALICDELIKKVDFVSIGTNDLTQYLLAIDRENPNVLETYKANHKSILRLIYHIAKIVKENNKEVGICGELARDKTLLGFFIKCGIDEISVSASNILECKKNITEIDTRKIIIKDYI